MINITKTKLPVLYKKAKFHSFNHPFLKSSKAKSIIFVNHLLSGKEIQKEKTILKFLKNSLSFKGVVGRNFIKYPSDEVGK